MVPETETALTLSEWEPTGSGSGGGAAALRACPAGLLVEPVAHDLYQVTPRHFIGSGPPDLDVVIRLEIGVANSSFFLAIPAAFAELRLVDYRLTRTSPSRSSVHSWAKKRRALRRGPPAAATRSTPRRRCGTDAYGESASPTKRVDVSDLCCRSAYDDFTVDILREPPAPRALRRVSRLLCVTPAPARARKRCSPHASRVSRMSVSTPVLSVNPHHTSEPSLRRGARPCPVLLRYDC